MKTNLIMYLKDFVEEKSNHGTEVAIYLAFSRDLCDPLRETVWRGLIEQIPKQYLDLEVLSCGRSLNASIPILTVFNNKE